MPIMDLCDFVLIGVILIQFSVLARLWYIVKDLDKYVSDRDAGLDKRIDDVSSRCWDQDKRLGGLEEVLRWYKCNPTA